MLSVPVSCETLTLILWPFGDHQPRLWQWFLTGFPGSSFHPSSLSYTLVGYAPFCVCHLLLKAFSLLPWILS